MSSPNTLVLFAHPAYQLSRNNRALAEAARTTPGVTFHDLYEAYPDFLVNVRREQELLVAHDHIVWQHPFYWYSSPSILKEWQDLVLQYGFAYGEDGKALTGKHVLNAITTGGTEESYCHDGHNRFTVRELLAPFEQTAHLCGMRYLPPFALHGTGQVDDAALEAHAGRYRRLLTGLVEGTLDTAAAAASSACEISAFIPDCPADHAR